VNSRDLLYKNHFEVYFKIRVLIGKGGHKIISNLNRVSYNIENQLFTIIF